MDIPQFFSALNDGENQPLLLCIRITQEQIHNNDSICSQYRPLNNLPNRNHGTPTSFQRQPLKPETVVTAQCPPSGYPTH